VRAAAAEEEEEEDEGKVSAQMEAEVRAVPREEEGKWEKSTHHAPNLRRSCRQVRRVPPADAAGEREVGKAKSVKEMVQDAAATASIRAERETKAEAVTAADVVRVRLSFSPQDGL